MVEVLVFDVKNSPANSGNILQIMQHCIASSPLSHVILKPLLVTARVTYSFILVSDPTFDLQRIQESNKLAIGKPQNEECALAQLSQFQAF